MAIKGESFQGDEKQKDVRRTNIIAAKAVADAIRTSLGPKGMDKMITTASGKVVITNDGATILKKIDVIHPAARMICNISKAQDVEAGDGTTSVVVICGALLHASQQLLDKDFHPSVISEAFLVASLKAQEILRSIAIPVDLSNKKALVDSAVTSLNSKVVSNHSELLAPLSVDAVLEVTQDLQKSDTVDLNDIRIIKKLGGTIEDTEMVKGLVLTQSANTQAGGSDRCENAKIALIQFCLSAPKTDMDNKIVVNDYENIDLILKQERKYIAKMIKKIYKSGCNVLLVQKSVLRDAVNDLALHYCAKKKITVITDIDRKEIEFVAKTLNCIPIADIDNFDKKKFGIANLLSTEDTGQGLVTKITGIKNQGKTVSILCRGSNRLVLDEAERSVHDALCVIRCLVKEKFLIPGGGAPETELSIKLSKYADTLEGAQAYCVKAYAEALEVIPYTLAQNAGLNPIKIVTELRKKHSDGEIYAGINVRKSTVTDILKEHVIQPLLVSVSALKLATECTRMLLKIDDLVVSR